MSKKKNKKRSYSKRKYGQRTRTEDGFASKLESKMWKEVKKILPKNHKLSYETHKLPYVLEKNYVPDFIIHRPDGSTIFLEVKGFFRPSDRTKLLAVKRLEPTVDIRLVFARDNKLHSKSNTTYSAWCVKNGFKFSVGGVPREWFQSEPNGAHKRRHRSSHSRPSKQLVRNQKDRAQDDRGNLDLFANVSSKKQD